LIFFKAISSQQRRRNPKKSPTKPTIFRKLSAMPDPRVLSEKLYYEFNQREQAQLNELKQK